MWSAPNYCYRSGNLASILQLSETLERHFEVFNEEDADKRTYPSNQSVRYMLLPVCFQSHYSLQWKVALLFSPYY